MKSGVYLRNSDWLDFRILRFVSLAVWLSEFEVKHLEKIDVSHYDELEFNPKYENRAWQNEWQYLMYDYLMNDYLMYDYLMYDYLMYDYLIMSQFNMTYK